MAECKCEDWIAIYGDFVPQLLPPWGQWGVDGKWRLWRYCPWCGEKLEGDG